MIGYTGVDADAPHLYHFYYLGGSSNGRTPGFGPGNRGSSPCPPARVKSARSGHFYVELADKQSTFVLCVGREPPEAYRTERERVR